MLDNREPNKALNTTAASGQSQSESINFDDYSSSYEDLLRESTKRYADDSEFFARYKIDLVAGNMSSPPRRVLEYGCGTGRNIRYIRAVFPSAEIVGTDISAASLEVARSAQPGASFEVEHDELDIGTFDLIFVANVFHHIPPAERSAAMRTIARRLTPTGSVFIFEHNPYNPITQRIVSTCPFDADAILLKPSELRALFSGAKIRLQKMSYCLFIPPKLSWLLPIEKFLGWLPLGGQYWLAGRPSRSARGKLQETCPTKRLELTDEPAVASEMPTLTSPRGSSSRGLPLGEMISGVLRLNDQHN